MNPTLVNSYEENNVYRFTLNNIHVSFANALRRVLLSDIPVVVFYTLNNAENKCVIHENTSRLHNEIIKHRLGCVPIHTTDLNNLPEKYLLELNVSNNTDTIMYITTEHFKIVPKPDSGAPELTEEELRKIFPKNSITQQYIDFARLRPKIGDSVPGEKLHFTSEFSVSTAGIDNMFNVVSKCAYAYTIDKTKSDEALDELIRKWKEDGLNDEEIQFNRNNFRLLDAQRYFVENSFDFVVESVGIYDNRELIKMSAALLRVRLAKLIEKIDTDNVPVLMSETTMNNCYDIILENEDYTIGKILEYLLYSVCLVAEKKMSFCGFKKMHPHDADSVIRVAFHDNIGKIEVRQCLRSACIDALNVFNTLYKMF
jgi:DNA-directed RNA polymerase subunit L